MWHAKHEDVEMLLRRDVRASLPLGRQFLLYLDPCALFKDASRGRADVQRRARSYNCAMRWLLLPYLQRWIMIAASLFLGIAPVEALAAGRPWFIILAAAFAVGCCVAVAVIVYTAAAYLLLGLSDKSRLA
ncbi:MAG: hypothetical protein A3G24_07345 [Betaproteobacteria bacterium RIFCSPLOWO2_12_FULL_62_13]|nr:MAG: hypothetical protein A3G24_07345 [Betaproteobacteria bacterium RIFCSPLOWO2_12_FULL_62_13]